MTAKIKNIIFDLGGVILGIDEQLTFNELKKAGFTDMELLQSPEIINLLSKFDTGVYTAKTFRKKLKAALNVSKMTDEKFDSIWNAMLLDIPRAYRSHRKGEETLQDFLSEQFQRNPLRPLCQGLAVAFRLSGI